MKEVFDSLNELEVNESIQNKTLELRYYGSGDSGYLEDYFDGTSILIPSKIEDWCYRQLENDFGGWEINEGSQGYFLFYLDQKEIELSHTMNVEEQSYDTLLEFDFSE